MKEHNITCSVAKGTESESNQTSASTVKLWEIQRTGIFKTTGQMDLFFQKINCKDGRKKV